MGSLTPAVSLQRLRCQNNIPRLVFLNTPIDSFCDQCRISAVKFVESSYFWYQRKTRSIMKVNDFCLECNQNRKTEDTNISALLQQIKFLRKRQENLTDYFISIKRDEIKLKGEMKEKIDYLSKISLDANEIESRKRDLLEDIVDITAISQRAERETDFLHSRIYPLVNILIPDPYRSKQFTSAHTINGYALSLYPNIAANTTWQEINAAWGLVGLIINGIIRKLNIPSSSVKYLVSSLRNKVIIRRYQVVSIEERSLSRYIRYNDLTEEASLGMTLILEGRDLNQLGLKHSNYIEAIAAIAVVIASLAQIMKRTNALVGLLTKVIPVIEKYGPDVIVSDLQGSNDSSRKYKSYFPQGAGHDLQSFGQKAELLPHWRFLFFSSTERISAIGQLSAARKRDSGGILHGGYGDIAVDILSTVNNLLCVSLHS
jgi:hypothetical protein